MAILSHFRNEAVGHYHHEEAVYCVSLPYDDDNMFATAGECGAVFIWDVRVPDGKYCTVFDDFSRKCFS